MTKREKRLLQKIAWAAMKTGESLEEIWNFVVLCGLASMPETLMVPRVFEVTLARISRPMDARLFVEIIRQLRGLEVAEALEELDDKRLIALRNRWVHGMVKL